jgi:hypothetical protein
VSTHKIVSSTAVTTASVLVDALVVASVTRDQMFTNLPALQADLLVEETEMRIVKDGFTGLHVTNGQKIFLEDIFYLSSHSSQGISILNCNCHKSQNGPIQ